jgi:hypothetical protein
VRARLATSLSVSVLIGVSEARAATDTSATLEYQVTAKGAGCPDAETFRSRVTARLGVDPFVAGAKKTIRATIADAPKKTLSGDVSIFGPDGALTGQRVLTAPARECAELVESLAATVALMLDPLGEAKSQVKEPTAPDSQPAPAQLAPSVQQPPALPPPPSSPSPMPLERAPVGPMLGAGLMASVARGPSLTLGGFLYGGMHFERASIALEGSFESTLGPALTGQDRILTRFILLGPRACHRIYALQGCIFSRLGAVQANAPDLRDAQTQTAFSAFAGASLGLPVSFGRSEFVPWLEVAVPVARARLLAGQDVLWTAPFLSASLGLALGWIP